MVVIKRDGSKEDFDLNKIENAVLKAMTSVNEVDTQVLEVITNNVYDALKYKDVIHIERIQDIVEDVLISYGLSNIAKEYILFRDNRRKTREIQANMYESSQKAIDDIMNLKNIENSNANVDEGSFSGKNAKVQSHFLKEYALNHLMLPKVADAHRSGLLYTHDLESYASGQHNCLTIDFTDLFENNRGFETRNGDVRKPNDIMTFFQLMAVVFQCQSQVQFGGLQ